MKVSIITVTYNSAEHISDCIKSVYDQSYSNIEHIIIDGKSNDKTIDIIKETPNKVVKIVSEQDEGIYDAMNKGICAATGNIIGILNSDDFFSVTNAVETIVLEFQKDPSLDAVYTDLYYVKKYKPQQIVRHWKSKSFVKNSFFYGWHPPHPTLYLKKEIYNKYGDFNLNFSLSADFEFMLRVFEKHKIKSKYLPISTIRMRLGGATSKNLKNIMIQNIQCLNAFKENGYNIPILYPFLRLAPKLFQFFNCNGLKILDRN